MPGGDDARRRGRAPSAAERDLWYQAMRDATPIRSGRRSPAEPTTPPPADGAGTETGPARADGAGGRPGQSTPDRSSPPRATPPPRPEPKPEPALAPGRFADLDRRTADRLRRGRLAIDRRLDLHGMTQAAAHGALVDALLEAAERGQRCVLVITGKGRSGGEAGVLRRQVPHWLNMAPLRTRIVAIAEAQPRHGGAGALYVLLRRKRG